MGLLGDKLPNGFRIGQIVSGYGHRPPGDGFRIPNGEVRPNHEGGYYHDSPSVVLVRGPIGAMSSRAVRTRRRLEVRGVYFHIDDVRLLRFGRGVPVPVTDVPLHRPEDLIRDRQLMAVADRLENIEAIMHKNDHRKRMLKEEIDTIRRIAGGN